MSQSLPAAYQNWLVGLKTRIADARHRVATSVNTELVRRCWEIGSDILARQGENGWGAKIIDLLAADLNREFPGIKGFSPRNLKYMRKFAASWSAAEIVQQPVAQLAWSQHVILLDKLEDREQRIWYAMAAIHHGWTRNVLAHHVETQLYARQGKAISNFTTTLPAEQAEVAAGIFKDPYVLDFISLDESVRERHLERTMIARIKNLLLELGTGFSFIGNQYHLEVGGDDFYLDLLFYHTRLHCYVVVDIKTGDFKPEFAGKMNFYLTAVDTKLRDGRDSPTIGLILCRGKNGLVAEYTLRDMSKPMAVAEYRVLPPELVQLLPSPEEIELQLQKET